MEIAQLMIFWSKCLVACFLVFGMFFVASGIVDRFLGKDVLSARWSATIVVGLWIATIGFHLLAATGILRFWVVMVAVACMVGMVRFSGYSFRTLINAMRHDELVLKNFLLLETNPLQKCLLIILAMGVLLVAGRGAILPPLSWDALTYHAVKAGMWAQSGQIRLMEAPGGWSHYRMFPGGGETLQALSMLPFHSDLLVCLVDFVEWLCLIPALFLLGRCVGLERKSSFIGGLFCLFLPCVVFSVGSCYVDLILA